MKYLMFLFSVCLILSVLPSAFSLEPIEADLIVPEFFDELGPKVPTIETGFEVSGSLGPFIAKTWQFEKDGTQLAQVWERHFKSFGRSFKIRDITDFRKPQHQFIRKIYAQYPENYHFELVDINRPGIRGFKVAQMSGIFDISRKQMINSCSQLKEQYRTQINFIISRGDFQKDAECFVTLGDFKTQPLKHGVLRKRCNLQLTVLGQSPTQRDSVVAEIPFVCPSESNFFSILRLTFYDCRCANYSEDGRSAPYWHWAPSLMGKSVCDAFPSNFPKEWLLYPEYYDERHNCRLGKAIPGIEQALELQKIEQRIEEMLAKGQHIPIVVTEYNNHGYDWIEIFSYLPPELLFGVNNVVLRTPQDKYFTLQQKTISLYGQQRQIISLSPEGPPGIHVDYHVEFLDPTEDVLPNQSGDTFSLYRLGSYGLYPIDEVPLIESTTLNVSHQVHHDHESQKENDVIQHWCDSHPPYGEGGIGTPGRENNPCK